MLVLYRTPNSPFADAIEEKLQDWVLAHRVVLVGGDGAPSEAPPEAPPAAALPALREGRNLYTGAEAITAFLDELGRELTIGRQFGSDACYLDPANPKQCL